MSFADDNFSRIDEQGMDDRYRKADLEPGEGCGTCSTKYLAIPIIYIRRHSSLS